MVRIRDSHGNRFGWAVVEFKCRRSIHGRTIDHCGSKAPSPEDLERQHVRVSPGQRVWYTAKVLEHESIDRGDATIGCNMECDEGRIDAVFGQLWQSTPSMSTGRVAFSSR